ncbi:MAG: hypothetical protein ACHQW9_00525 [Nitrososphaerales archaeon]
MTFAGILKECNRLVYEQELRERSAYFKSQLARLDIDYNKGLIDTQTYNKRQLEILKDLDGLSNQKIGDPEGDTSIEF